MQRVAGMHHSPALMWSTEFALAARSAHGRSVTVFVYPPGGGRPRRRPASENVTENPQVHPQSSKSVPTSPICSIQRCVHLCLCARADATEHGARPTDVIGRPLSFPKSPPSPSPPNATSMPTATAHTSDEVCAGCRRAQPHTHAHLVTALRAVCRHRRCLRAAVSLIAPH